MNGISFKSPNRRGLLLLGLVFLIAAAGVAINGIVHCSQANQSVQQWTTSRSMLVGLQTNNPDRRLKAGAYCRVHF